jgi:hypothetical protein
VAETFAQQLADRHGDRRRRRARDHVWIGIAATPAEVGADRNAEALL